MFLVDFGALYLLTYLWIRRSNALPFWGERLALAFALVLPLKALLIFVLILARLQPDIWIQTSLSVIVLVLGCALCLKRGTLPARAPGTAPAREWTLPHIAAVSILGLLFAASMMNALFFPVTEADGIWYFIKGLAFFHETDLESDRVVDQLRQYPPFVPLLYAYLFSLGWSKVKILFPLLYLCLLVIFYYRLLEETRLPGLAAIFTLILGTTPYLWWHSTLPLLDWTAAFYFSLGTFYWFVLIRFLLEDRSPPVPSSLLFFAFASGLFYGVAAWTRMEFLLYDAVPLLLLMGVLARPVPLAPADKDTLLFTHAGPLLFWVSGWFLVLFTFKTPLDSRVNALSVGCGLIWLAVLAFRIRGLRFSKAGLGVAAVLAPLLFLGLLWADRGNLAAVAGSISIAVFRTVVVHGFYVFTSLMVLWIFWNGLRTLNRGQKLLGVLLGFYLLVHFAVFSYSVPKWDTLAEFVRFTFIEPGRSVNLSDTRSMLGLYPSLVFFVAGLPRLKRRFGHGPA